MVRALEALCDGDREAARNAVGAASDLLPRNDALESLADSLKEDPEE
jgi:hypothetical protein